MNTKISEVENKIPNTGSLVTKTVLNTKISEIENKIRDYAKYITTQEFNKFTAKYFEARLKQADLANKTDFDNKLSLIDELLPIKKKHLEVQKKLNSLLANDYNYNYNYCQLLLC